MKLYNPLNWYWSVSGRTPAIYSSAIDAFVQENDATYQNWLVCGGIPTTISWSDFKDMRIKKIEALVTPRMLQEAVAGFTTTFPSNHAIFPGMTAKQAIEHVRDMIETQKAEQ